MAAEERTDSERLERPWSVYLVRTGSGALYTGISTNPQRRLEEHRGDRRGAKALRQRGPLELVYSAVIGTRSLATRLELQIKRMPKSEKEALATQQLTTSQLLEALDSSRVSGEPTPD